MHHFKQQAPTINQMAIMPFLYVVNYWYYKNLSEVLQVKPLNFMSKCTYISFFSFFLGDRKSVV